MESFCSETDSFDQSGSSIILYCLLSIHPFRRRQKSAKKRSKPNRLLLLNARQKRKKRRKRRLVVRLVRAVDAVQPDVSPHAVMYKF